MNKDVGTWERGEEEVLCGMLFGLFVRRKPPMKVF